MSSYSRGFIIIASISAGIITIGFFFYRRIKLSKKAKPREVGDDEKNMSLGSVRGEKKNRTKNQTESATNASSEIIKKNDLAITKQANFYMEKIDANKEEDNCFKQIIHSKEVEDILTRRLTETVTKTLENENNSSNEKMVNHKLKVPAKTAKNDMKKLAKQTSITKDKTSYNFNNTILNIVNDLKIVESVNNRIKKYAKDNHLDTQGQTSIYLPQLTIDMDDEFQLENDEEGYMQENEDFEIPFLSNELTIDGELDIKAIEKYSQIKHKESSNKVELIYSAEELDDVLFSKEYNATNRKDQNYNVQTEFQVINNEEKIEVIKGDLFLVILKYLFAELNSGLIELSDNFVEQRRLYLETDHSTYISIINLFLRKKEEFFLGVLSEIMSTLSISQNLLDNTFVYYTNFADQDIKIVGEIRLAYDMVYKAGIKSTITPRNLNKQKLKEILEFQCQKYEELIKEFNYELDVIDIMVIDHTYLEYGFDREAIKAAMQKHNVYEDKEFEFHLQKLENYQKNAFLNI